MWFIIASITTPQAKNLRSGWQHAKQYLETFAGRYRKIAIAVGILLVFLEFSALILIKLIGIENFQQVNQRELLHYPDMICIK